MGQEYGCSHRNPCFVHRPHSNCCDRYHNSVLGYFPGSLVCRGALWSGMSHPVTHGGPVRRPRFESAGLGYAALIAVTIGETDPITFATDHRGH
jgi:phospholipase C